MYIIQGLITLNVTVSIVFIIFYFYQIVYIAISLWSKKVDTNSIDTKIRNYAILVSARNEESVIPLLINSIKEQSYNQSNITVFVVADNCTDNTAKSAVSSGAIVYERHNNTLVGKGFAIDFLLTQIEKNHGLNTFDGFFVFDADNLLDKAYISEMNGVIDRGYDILTSYRNSKNYETNWITAGYSLWFLREARFMNHPRMLLGTGCAISGTGFFMSTKIIKENNGWPFHLLTEDIEFSIYSAIKGYKIGYCGTAVFYDEQPTTFAQSFRQRMRWTKGFYQVFGKYGLALTKTMILKKNFYAYDMFMTVLPGMVITSVTMAINLTVIIVGSIIGVDILPLATMFLSFLLTFYLLLFSIGLITTITEWKKIYAKNFFKIAYLFTFPLFMLTYMPIAIFAMFLKVTWKPILHTSTKTIADIQNKI